MNRFALWAVAAVGLAVAALAPGAAEAGCYRMGLTGYHWYGSCLGPGFIYPHHRVCRHGYCWYR